MLDKLPKHKLYMIDGGRQWRKRMDHTRRYCQLKDQWEGDFWWTVFKVSNIHRHEKLYLPNLSNERNTKNTNQIKHYRLQGRRMRLSEWFCLWVLSFTFRKQRTNHALQTTTYTRVQEQHFAKNIKICCLNKAMESSCNLSLIIMFEIINILGRTGEVHRHDKQSNMHKQTKEHFPQQQQLLPVTCTAKQNN